LVLANRTVEAARDVLDTVLDDTDSSLPCDAVSLDDVEAHLGAVDLVITATGAGSAVIRAEQVEASLTDRRAPLLVVDIGVPRDVEPSVADLDGVELLDMQTVAALTEASLAERRREVTAVRVIVDDELQRFAAVSNAREVDPVVTALRQRADDLRVGELTRHASRLAGLDAEQRASVEHLTRSLVAKLLHDPTVRLKDAAGSSRGDRLAESIRDLFDLPDDARGDTGADPLDPDRLD
jgi:glutamyl-tRNA reductase